MRNLNLDATTVNDRQGKYKRTSIKLNCLDSHDSIKESRIRMDKAQMFAEIEYAKLELGSSQRLKPLGEIVGVEGVKDSTIGNEIRIIVRTTFFVSQR